MTTPETPTLADVVTAVLGDEPPQAKDAAVAALALTYARQIDAGEGDLAKLGPPLLAALEALHLSPRARATASRGIKPDAKPVANPLDQLAARRAGKSRAPDLDAAAAGSE